MSTTAITYHYARREGRRGPNGPWHQLTAADSRVFVCGRMMSTEPFVEYARLEKTEPQRGPLICKDCTNAEAISRELLPCTFLKGKAP